MNGKLPSLMATLFCLATTSAFCDETNLLYRPPGMPTNELVAFVDPRQSTDSEDLAQALGVMPWNFQIQVPDGIVRLEIILHLIETNSDTDTILGKLLLNIEQTQMDSTGVIKSTPGVKQFRVLVVMCPLDTSTANPMFDSPKYRIFVKEFLTDISSAIIIKNPFKTEAGVAIYNQPRLVRDRKVPPGVWNGFGTSFDIMDQGNFKRELRISFERADMGIRE